MEIMYLYMYVYICICYYHTHTIVMYTVIKYSRLFCQKSSILYFDDVIGYDQTKTEDGPEDDNNEEGDVSERRLVFVFIWQVHLGNNMPSGKS